MATRSCSLEIKLLSVTLPLLVSCAAVEPHGGYGAEDVDGDGVPDDTPALAYEAGPFDKNDVLTDGELTDSGALDVTLVQAFLNKNPYGWKSVLATYTTGGKTAAQAIVDAAKAHGINPIVVLTRLQLEQSLIGKETATQKALDYAMGCGCPDNQQCNPAYKGFGKQVDCMAARFRSYLDDLGDGGTTVAGFGVGKGKKTLDGYTVTPENQATAAIYTYTPWVSSAKNHRKIWALFADTVGYDGPLPVIPDGASGAGGMDGAGGSGSGGAGGEGQGGGGPGPLELVIDNGGGATATTAFEASAEWQLGTSAPGKYGASYAYRSTGASADAALFRVYLESDRTVTIEAWWTAGANRSKTAPFLVFDAADTKVGTIEVNQQAGGAGWGLLGSFALSKGWNSVALSRWTTPGYVVVADAVRFTAP